MRFHRFSSLLEMPPHFERHFWPISSLTFIFFSWFCIQPWQEAFAEQASSSVNPSISSTVITSKGKKASEAFAKNFRFIKDKIHSLVNEDVSQKAFLRYLESYDSASQEITLSIRIIRQEIDRLGFSLSFERGGESDVSLKLVIAQRKKLRESMKNLSLGQDGIEAFLDGMSIPAKLRQNHLQTKLALKKQIQEMDRLVEEVSHEENKKTQFKKEAHSMFIHASGRLFTALKIHREHLEKLSKIFNPRQRRAHILEEVFPKMNEILDADRDIRSDFSQMEEGFKKSEFPEILLKRHAEAMQSYNEKFQGLQTFFKEINQANKAYINATQKNDTVLANTEEKRLKSKLKAFDLFLQKNPEKLPHTIYEPFELP